MNRQEAQLERLLRRLERIAELLELLIREQRKTVPTTIAVKQVS